MCHYKNLYKRTKNYKLDENREWTPAKSVPTGEGSGPEKKYTRGNPSDHKAQKVTLMLDIVEKGKECNRAIINYNNKEGWILYKSRSNFYAKEIMETVPKYRNKNERQQAFKQIMHRLDIECFGIKYKKSKSSARCMGKNKHKEVKELSGYIKAHGEEEKKHSKRN